MSAHPHYDFERGQVVNFATKFGANGVVSVYHHEGAARSRQVVGSWRTGRVPYLHSFGLTPDRAILVGHPFTARPLDMLWSNRGFIDHFEWRPSDGTRLVVIDRGTGAVSEFETDAMFVFHTVNAFTRGAETFLDVLAYPDADIMDELRVQRMITALPDLRPKLVRLRMHHGKRTVTPEPLADIGFEFPSINYRAVNGRAHRFVWGAANGPQPDGAYASSIVKVDLQGGVSSAYTDGERIFGEPVFVADPNGTDEDAGVLLSVGTSKQGESSALVVIDAKSMERVAMATVSHSIPLGFHGSFIREHAQGDA